MNKLTSEDELVGKTIRGVFEGKQDGNMVIVFDDNDWCVLEIDDHMSEEASIGIQFRGSRDSSIMPYLYPRNMLEAQLISQAQYDHIIKEEELSRANRWRRQAEQLLKDADALTQIPEMK